MKPAAETLGALDGRNVPTATTVDASIETRVGQARFRADLINLRGPACEVTGCRILEVLRASQLSRGWSRMTKNVSMPKMDYYSPRILTRYSIAV